MTQQILTGSIIILIVSLIALVVIHIREKRALVQKIGALEANLLDAKKETKARDEEIKHLKWQLDNPPKFKKGDKVGDLVVMDRKGEKPSLASVFLNYEIMADVIIAWFRKRPVPQKTIDNARAKFKSIWTYELIDTKTGDRVIKKEFELILLKNPQQ